MNILQKLTLCSNAKSCRCCNYPRYHDLGDVPTLNVLGDLEYKHLTKGTSVPKLKIYSLTRNLCEMLTLEIKSIVIIIMFSCNLKIEDMRPVRHL